MAEAASTPASTPLQRLRAIALPFGTVLAFLVFLLVTFPFDTLARLAHSKPDGELAQGGLSATIR